MSVSKDQLIELIAPAYGLNDAPLLWLKTLTSHLVQQGYRRSGLDPCLYIKYQKERLKEVHSLILIEVEDLATAVQEGDSQQLKDSLQSRFKFGSGRQENHTLQAKDYARSPTGL
jgi:hypothetical protein